MSRTVADVLVDVLNQVGVKQIFGLIVDSLNPLADAVRRSEIEWIGVRHEEGAALAAGIPAYREGIEFPNPDFAALARACGGHGFRATKPGELDAELNEAFAADGPAIVDAVVAADEMPNIPHVNLETVGHYA